jgi:hypothetical protein
MADKTLREALEESTKVAREAAVHALEAVEPGLKAVREAAGKIRERMGHGHLPRVDRREGTVQGSNCIYEVQAKKGGSDGAARYSVHRRLNNEVTELDVGSFDVVGSTMTVRCDPRISMTEISIVAAAWLEPTPPVTAPS